MNININTQKRRLPLPRLPQGVKVPRGALKVVKKVARGTARIGAAAVGGTVGGGIGLIKGTVTSPLHPKQVTLPQMAAKTLKVATGVIAVGASLAAVPLLGPALGFGGCALMVTGAALVGPALGGAVVGMGETLITSVVRGLTGGVAGAATGANLLLPIIDRILPPEGRQ